MMCDEGMKDRQLACNATNIGNNGEKRVFHFSFKVLLRVESFPDWDYIIDIILMVN